MKRAIPILVVAFAFMAGNVVYAQTPASFRVLLGVTDSASTRWDGTITARQAGNFKAEGWRFEGVDNINGRSVPPEQSSTARRDEPGGGGNCRQRIHH